MERDFEAYKYYVCPKCFNQIDKCTCEFFPPWSLICIDIHIQECIRVLNQKGYRTIYCCESHYDSEATSIYISFAMDYGFADTELPEGFKYEKRSNTIRFSCDIQETKENFEQIKKEKLNVITKWSYNLGDYVCVRKR